MLILQTEKIIYMEPSLSAFLK